MNISHRGLQPKIHESAYVAPTAVLAGDVTVGAESSIGFGSVLLAEGAPIEIGSQTVVRENVVIRAVPGYPVRIGNNVLIGPGSALNGCTIEDEVFLATRVTVFHDATIKQHAEVRINGIVHVATVVPAGATVPINWVAVGDPAQMFSPERHDEIWAVLRPLNFPVRAYGIERGPDGHADMREITRRVVRSAHLHRSDTPT
jgi:carbonic anhydrase/acetyltransferase-like protein (isoleucine patch superfamily)